MFSFFRFNDPYRLVIIFLILIIIGLPFILVGRQLTIPELGWMLVGEKMTEGYTLYSGVWSSISPLSAAVYWAIDAAFGRSLLTYQIIGLLLVFAQGVIFNNLLLHFKAYNENNYVPALIYILLMTSHFGFFTLSPILMSMTFLLIVIQLLFHYIQLRVKSDDVLLRIGVFLGIAVLFFLPVFLFLIVVILSLLLFTGVSVRRILLLIYGFLLPMLIAGAYFYFNDATREFLYQFIFSYLTLSGRYLVDLNMMIAISFIPLVYLFFAVIKVFGQTGFTNFQVRLQQIMFLMLIVGVLILLIVNNKAPYQLAIFVIPATFFITHYFLLIRRKFWREFLFVTFFITLVAINWGTYFIDFKTPWLSKEMLMVEETSLAKELEGKRILVMGDDIGLYQFANLATPYLDWRLARHHFASLDYYDNVTSIYHNFMSDPPDIIVDQEKLMPQLVTKIPALGNMYVKDRMGNVYRKR